MRFTRICDQEGCDQPHKARGMCKKHYMQWWQSTHERQNSEDICRIAGCVGPVVAKQLCRSHYRRSMRHGSPLGGAARRFRNRQCSVEGCDRKHEAKGFCRLHYQRVTSGMSLDGRSNRKPGRPFGQKSWNTGTSPAHICEVCGAEFRRHGRARQHRFCSKHCQAIGISGSNHPQWRGGDREHLEQIRKSRSYRIWRKLVLLRDGHQCQECGAQNNLEVDHIEPFVSSPMKRLDISNGRTLCSQCHRKTPTYGGKKASA